MSRSTIRIARDLSLPLDLVTESVAILAVKRAGKSHTAKKIVEQLHRVSQQVVVVDPKGDWWGLRSSEDGKSAGLPIVIVGGEHADVPLEPASGELVAQLAVRERVSVLLDLSELRKHQVATFMTAFLETLYRMKAKEQHRTPMMLVIDEADAIAPQRPQKGEERMLGAAEDIVRRGGQRGIGITLVSQRAAVLNKNVLTQCGVLVLLRTTGSQDIDAVDEWIKKHGHQAQREKVMASIAGMPRGDAWVWAPGWPDDDGIFKRVHVDACETFDSGATPKVGEKRATPKTLADVDLDTFKREMAETIERAEAEDPKALRKQLAESRAYGKHCEETIARYAGELEKETAASSILTDEDRRAIGAVSALLAEVSKLLRQQNERAIDVETARGVAYGYIESGIDELMQRLTVVVARVAPETRKLVKALPKTPLASARPEPRPAIRPPAMVTGPNGDAKKLGKGAREMLRSLKRMGPLTRAQLATLAGMSQSGTFRNYLSDLRTAGYITEQDEKIVASENGEEAAGPVDASPITTDDLVAIWNARLDAGARRMLGVLVQVYPRSLSRSELAKQTQMEESGTFRNYLSDLYGNGLVEKPTRSDVRAAEALFLGERR